MQFSSIEISKDDFLSQYNQKGYVLFPPLFDQDYMTRMKAILLGLIETEKQTIDKPDYKDYGFLLCAPYYADKYPEILHILEDERYLSYVEAILEKWFILYLYTNNCIPPNSGQTKAVRIHVDSPRIIPNYNYLLASIILLDDFTEENGATWIMPDSHHRVEPPSEEEFYNKSKRLIAPKGSVLFFNPRIWHAAGTNNSMDWRNCIILAFSKPWLKQRVDISRFMSHIDKTTISKKVQQVLGFNAQPPASFDEFYGDENMRTYTQPFV